MIYMVEDDAAIRELVVYTLQNTGFSAVGMDSAQELEQALSSALPELILLDIMLPGEDGISILRRLRRRAATRKIPVILLTAKGTEYDKVVGLDSGADDYLAKPFGMMELISRIKAVLRRAQSPAAEEELCCGEIRMNPAAHTVTVQGQPVSLTQKEFELLRQLLEHCGIVLTRSVLLERVWGYDFDGETRTVDVHIRTLRQKLGACADRIETIRGVGYRMEASV